MAIFNKNNQYQNDRVLDRQSDGPTLDIEKVSFLFKQILDYTKSLEKRIEALEEVEKNSCKCCDKDCDCE